MTNIEIFIAIAVPITVSLIAAGISIYTLRNQKSKYKADEGKTKAESASIYQDMEIQSAARIGTLKGRVEILEAQITQLKADTEAMEAAFKASMKSKDEAIKTKNDLIDEWIMGIDLLIDQLIEAKMVPSWRPYNGKR